MALRSYPNFGGPSKPLHHPDMQTLAMLAEQARVDLRILVVSRDARDTLVSTSVHRLGEFPPWHEEAAVLGNAAAALAAELALVDPRFLVCARFSVATNPGAHRGAWARDLGPALHPAVDAALIDAFIAGRATDTTAVAKDRRAIPAEPPSPPGAYDPHVEHLEKMGGLVDAACRREGGIRIVDEGGPAT